MTFSPEEDFALRLEYQNAHELNDDSYILVQ